MGNKFSLLIRCQNEFSMFFKLQYRKIYVSLEKFTWSWLNPEAESLNQFPSVQIALWDLTPLAIFPTLTAKSYTAESNRMVYRTCLLWCLEFETATQRMRILQTGPKGRGEGIGWCMLGEYRGFGCGFWVGRVWRRSTVGVEKWLNVIRNVGSVRG